MARPKQYDTEYVKQQTLISFLKKGYSATSLNDLESSTGLGRRSLYNDFGDKKSMFLNSLSDFKKHARKAYLSPLSDRESGIDAISTVLNSLLVAADTDEGRFGCLICNTARESIMEDAEVNSEVTSYFDQLESSLLTVLVKAKQNEEISSDANPASLARFFLGIIVSVCVLCRSGAPKETLSDIVTEALNHI